MIDLNIIIKSASPYEERIQKFYFPKTLSAPTSPSHLVDFLSPTRQLHAADFNETSHCVYELATFSGHNKQVIQLFLDEMYLSLLGAYVVNK